MKSEFPNVYVRSERAIRERQSWTLAMLIALVLLTCFAFPMAFLQGCDDSDFRKAARAAAAIGTSLDEIQQLNEDAYAHSLIDRDEALAIAKFVREAALANQHFTTSLRGYRKLNKESKAELVRLMADVARSIQALNEQGVLHIKNPSARVKFTGAIGGAIASLDILAQLIGTYETPAPANVLNTSFKEGVAVSNGHSRRSRTLQLRAADTSEIRHWAKAEGETGATAGEIPRNDDVRPRLVPMLAAESLRGAA